MGVLREESSSVTYTLSPRTVLGRGRACTVCVSEAVVSSEHASVAWSGSRWEIRDLASRNGTFVDGERIPTGEDRELRAGAAVSLGAPEVRFCFVDDGPP